MKEIVTLCGSTRFKEQFIYWREKLTLDGYVVLGPELYLHTDYPNWTEDDPTLKQSLDELHRDKIWLSDWIFVINPNGYIGESTKNEIEYAHYLGIPVKYLKEPNE